MTHTDGPPVVVGVDVGGSHTRVVIACADGQVLGRWNRPGGNPWSNTTTDPATLRSTITEAVAAAGSPRPTRAVIGMAGLIGPVHQRLDEQLAPLVAEGIEITIVPDVVVNHAAGDPEPTGLVVAAGTGAIAAAIAHGTVKRQVDGHGWLLGDEGSAVWIGRQAVRATLHALDGRGPHTPLADTVIDTLVGSGPHTDAITHLLATTVMNQDPARLGRLAPDVIAQADHDHVASQIITRAAEHIAETTLAVTDDWSTTRRIVFAGSLLLHAPSIAQHVARRLHDTAPHVEILQGPDGAAGAASVAFHLAGSPLGPRIHHTLCRPRQLDIRA